MRKVFVTGATGNIGKHLVNYLSEMNISFTAGSRTIKKTNYPTCQINYDDPETLNKAFKGHQVLFLLIADSDKSKNWAKNAVASAKVSGIKHIIRSSGINANSESKHFVFKELGIIENIVKSSGLDYTIIQPNSFLQMFATHQNESIKHGKVFLPHENAKISYVDVRDVALAVAQIIEDVEAHKLKTYVITGGEAVTDQHLLNEIGKVIKKIIEYISVSDAETIATFQKYQMPEHDIKQLISLYQADRAGETKLISQDFEKLTEKKPRTVNDFAKDYQQHWK